MNTPEQYESDLLFYFAGKLRELALYRQLFCAIERAFPNASVKVQKSQISFYCPKLFAAASILVRRKKDCPGSVSWSPSAWGASSFPPALLWR